jgi:hypothetical protein
VDVLPEHPADLEAAAWHCLPEQPADLEATAEEPGTRSPLTKNTSAFPWRRR